MGILDPVPFEDFYFGEQPNAALFNVFKNLGVGGTSPLSKFIQGSQNRYYTKYLADLPSEPNMTYRDFLRRLNPSMEFSGLAPRQRGEDPNLYSPRIRYLFGR